MNQLRQFSTRCYRDQACDNRCESAVFCTIVTETNPEVHRGIGIRVRASRQALGWTLDDLAAASSVSRRMIVSVEQGTVNASIGTLLRLSDALGVGIPALVSPERVAPRAITRRGDGTRLWESVGGGRGILLAGTAPPDVLELWEWSLCPGDRHVSEAHRIGTREIVHVREGRVCIETGDRSVDLSEGDTLVFETDVDHAYANPHDQWARFSLVVLEPNVYSSKEINA
jgi:transcriptional regulator with XRE-family HTH domain